MANWGTAGFAAPAQTVPGSLAAMILGQGLALVAVGADLRLQDSLGSCFFGRFPAVPGDLMPGTFCVPVTDQEPGNRTLMPALDFSRDSLQVLPRRLGALAGILNF